MKHMQHFEAQSNSTACTIPSAINNTVWKASELITWLGYNGLTWAQFTTYTVASLSEAIRACSDLTPNTTKRRARKNRAHPLTYYAIIQWFLEEGLVSKLDS